MQSHYVQGLQAAMQGALANASSPSIIQVLVPNKFIPDNAVWKPKEDGSATPAYRVLDMHFTDYGAASKAVTTERHRRSSPRSSSWRLAVCGSSSQMSRRSERD